jgi:transcription antitermination factor NusG
MGKTDALSPNAVGLTGDPVAAFIFDSQCQWFAVVTKSHHEKRVAQQYAERQIEHFLPLYQSVRHWTNYRKVTLELPLFPNYLFVRITRQERLRALTVSGVLSMIGRGNEPTPLPDFEIDLLRSGLHLRSFEPYPHLAIGAKARIKAGALAGMEGIVLRKKNSFRVVLTVDLIMQSFAVEVDASELEPPAEIPAVDPRKTNL